MEYLVTLVPKRNNGRMRHVRVMGAPDWDESLAAAENYLPGWNAIQSGEYIAGAATYLEIETIGWFA